MQPKHNIKNFIKKLPDTSRYKHTNKKRLGVKRQL
jgi:hypothetical protein